MFDKFSDYIKDNKCPICERELEKDSDAYRIKTFCKNNCFKLMDSLLPFSHMIFIFEKSFSFSPNERDFWPHLHNNLYNYIESWKKDSRYLMKILERS